MGTIDAGGLEGSSERTNPGASPAWQHAPVQLSVVTLTLPKTKAHARDTSARMQKWGNRSLFGRRLHGKSLLRASPFRPRSHAAREHASRENSTENLLSRRLPIQMRGLQPPSCSFSLSADMNLLALRCGARKSMAQFETRSDKWRLDWPCWRPVGGTVVMLGRDCMQQLGQSGTWHRRDGVLGNAACLIRPAGYCLPF